MSEPSIDHRFFSESLVDNPASLPVNADALAVKQADGRAVVRCRRLEIQQYARLGCCELTAAETPTPIHTRYWGGEDYDRLYTHYDQVVWEVEWQGNQFTVIDLSWETGCGSENRLWVIGDSVELAEAFVLDVERKTHAPGEAILVFSSGRWNRSESLYGAVQAASFEDLILADDLKASIREDFASFLGSEDRYNRLGIAWRRGALMIGPPGNGKTHCVRALLKELNVSSLYVQSLSHKHYTDEQMWRQVFERARGLRPCVLVLEDLDSLVNEENRSFFLNQLDGLEQNHGLIVLATTNHPERIDSAIIDRPSRFDRKYHFKLPTREGRLNYLQAWQSKLEQETSWQRDEVEGIADACDGFSFAYLKELIISSTMKWMQFPEASFAAVMETQARMLGSQMKTESDRPPRTNGRPRRPGRRGRA